MPSCGLDGMRAQGVNKEVLERAAGEMQRQVESKPKVRRGHAKQDAPAVCCLVFAGRAMPRAPAVARSSVQPSSIVQCILLQHCAVYLTAVLHACGGKWQAPTPKSVTPRGEGGRAPRKSCPNCRKVLSSAPPPLRTWCMGMHWSTLFVEQSVRASRSMCVVARARASRTLCAKPFSASCKAIARVGC